ncbi:MAG: homoserine kinase [Polyangiaceae bacterium]
MALITPVDSAELAIFLEDYDLGRLIRATPLEAGSVNSNFALELGAGRFFLRLYEEQDFDGARRDADTAAELAKAGVPTPAPIERRLEGPHGSLLGELAHKPAVILPWCEGDIICQKRVTRSHVRAVGAALASMHLSGAALASRYGAGRFRYEDLQKRIDRIASAKEISIARVAQKVRDRLESVHRSRDVNLPRGLSHGDLFRDNVLFGTKDKMPIVLALLDFESAHEGSLVYDLMVTTLAWCVGDALDTELARALVSGYESVRKLDAIEKAGAHAEARFAAVRFWITRITDYAMRLGVGKGRDPKRFEMRLDAIESMGASRFEKQIFV